MMVGIVSRTTTNGERAMHIHDKREFTNAFNRYRDEMEWSRMKLNGLRDALLDYIGTDDKVMEMVKSNSLVLLTMYIREFLEQSGYPIGLLEGKEMAETVMRNLKD